VRRPSGILVGFLQRIAKIFAGKGLVDRHASFLIPMFQRLYARVQSDAVMTVPIPLHCTLAVSARDIGVGLPLIIKGAYEPLQTELFLASLHEGDVLWDIGANVGYYAVLAARKVGPSGKVVAFEPDHGNLLLLRDNARMNGCANIVIEDKAVSDREGWIAFSSEEYSKGQSAVILDASSQRYHRVRSITLDSFIANEGQECPTLVKMDIEGAEVLALQGARKAFSRCMRIKLFIEYNPSSIGKLGYDPESMLTLLQELDFEITDIVDEARERVLPYSPGNLARTLRHATYCNLVCQQRERSRLE
jgi:FkbM family methyltransferase